jgi:ferredoxin--NADP+ reductase/benzoate/toluate 1,2-dioxygenase reductase subunit
MPYRKIKEIRFLSESTFIIRFERENFFFVPGQYVIVGVQGSLNHREYSIYSGDKQDYIEILVRSVIEGNVSRQLMETIPGQMLDVNGPFGTFKLEKKNMFSRKHIFIATGTGISPFHSIVKSYPGINYTILHGIRFKNETYENFDFDPERYIACISGEKKEKYSGRVTRFLPEIMDEPDTIYYICGNSNMIYEVTNSLKIKGVSGDRILTEVYF